MEPGAEPKWSDPRPGENPGNPDSRIQGHQSSSMMKEKEPREGKVNAQDHRGTLW